MRLMQTFMTQIATFVSTLALLAGAIAFAQAPAPSPETPARKARPARRMMNRLDLSESQKQQAKTLFEQSRQNAEPIRQQLKKNREALTAAIKANDPGQIQQLSTQQGQLRGQLLSVHADTRAKFLSTLTPEQRARVESAKPGKRLKQRFFQRRNG
jgi:Spy/CpxP family protein refolding chaperone